MTWRGLLPQSVGMLHPTVPDGLCVAFYKGVRPGVSGLYNRLGRFLDRGPYSHCELIFSDGLSASSSFMDGGVRPKDIGYSSVGSWDFLPVPAIREYPARTWFQRHYGQEYDIWGNVRFATNFAKDSPDKWFCSEAVAAALGYPQAYRYGPCGLASMLSYQFETKIIEVNP